jgi:hypothetical protein
MQCGICARVLWTRKSWFNPQWQAQSPTVLGHQGGDFDRCKDCYSGGALATCAPAPNDHTAKTLALAMFSNAARLRCIAGFVRAFVNDSLLVKTFSGFGMIEVESENDPKQSRRTDGVWTFDPRNRVYAKTFHLVWPELVDDRNDVSLGNIIEAILGVLERALKQRHPLGTDLAVLGVCKAISTTVHSMYQFVQYTDTEHVPMTAFLRTATDVIRD